MTQTLRNWAGNVGYGAASMAGPTSVPELQELVANSSRIKAIGTRHSFSTIADTPGTLVSTAGLPAEIVIDDSAMTVRVNGATSYGVLAGELQSQGYALQNMGSLPHISVAGATATGTHGSGDRNGILSTSIAAIDLVTADGERTTIDRSAADLAAIAVGLGAFGVIVGLTLDIQPTFTVRQDIYLNVPWSTALEQFDDIMSSAYSVSLMGRYAGPTVQQLWCKVRLGDGGSLLRCPNRCTAVPGTTTPTCRKGTTSMFAAASPGRGPSGCRTSGWIRRPPRVAMNCRANGSSIARTLQLR